MNQNPREASRRSRILLISHLFVCMYVFVYLCIYLCRASWLYEKRYRTAIWYTHSPWQYPKTGVLFFRKTWHNVTLDLKDCSVTWIFSISRRLPCNCNFQNPREASSRSRIFLNSLVYLCIWVCIYLFIHVCHVSWPNEKR